jgi:hypothetical protein
VASLDGEEQSSGKIEISSSSLLHEDKAEGRRTWRRHRMAGAWRWRGGVATRGEHGDEAMARAFKRWVRLTGRPSPLLIYSNFQKLQLQNSQT